MFGIKAWKMFSNGWEVEMSIDIAICSCTVTKWLLLNSFHQFSIPFPFYLLQDVIRNDRGFTKNRLTYDFNFPKFQILVDPKFCWNILENSCMFWVLIACSTGNPSVIISSTLPMKAVLIHRSVGRSRLGEQWVPTCTVNLDLELTGKPQFYLRIY